MSENQLDLSELWKNTIENLTQRLVDTRDALLSNQVYSSFREYYVLDQQLAPTPFRSQELECVSAVPL